MALIVSLLYCIKKKQQICYMYKYMFFSCPINIIHNVENIYIKGIIQTCAKYA